MPYNLIIVPKSGFLHAAVKGDNTPENVRNYLQDIQNACETKGFKKVLIEENLTGPTIGTFEIFSLVTKLGPDAARAKLRIAYVDMNQKHDMNAMHFAESTARNRYVNIKMFSNTRDAEAWLLESEPTDDSVKR